MARNRAFNKPEPACKYCLRSQRTEDDTIILCPKKGVVLAEDSCRRFKYDPLKRQPGNMPELGNYTADQFEL